MRAASYLLVAVAACGGGPATPPQSPDTPVRADTPVHTDTPLGVDPPVLDAGAAPTVDEPAPIDAGAAPPTARVAVLSLPLTPQKVSWPKNRRPAQLHLLGGNASSSWAAAVSADGSTPVGFATGPRGEPQAVRWRDGMLTPLGTNGSIAGQPTWALATSRNGDVVAGSAIRARGITTPLSWNAGGDATVLATPDGLDQASALAVSRDGSIITGCAGWCAVLVTWSGGTWEAKPGPAPGSRQFAPGTNATSEDAAIVAGTVGTHTDDPEGLRLAGATVERLGAGTRVDGISDDGAVLVGSAGGRAALWRGTKVTDLGVLEGYDTCHATAVSADGGRVVGTCHRSDVTQRRTVAFIWDKKRGLRTVRDALAKEHEVRLPDELWIDQASDICGYGLTVVGGAHAKKGQEAFMAIVPR